MNETQLSPDVNEAKNMVADIVQSINAIEEWSSNEAENTIHALFDEWEALCANTDSAKSRKFCEQCENILQKCTSFQNNIVAKNDSFTGKVQVDLVDIFDKASDNEIIKSLLEDVIGHLWNKIERPRLLFLYEKSVELETSIRDMIEFAMSA